MPPVRLFIGNLPYQATEDDLRTHFSAVGEPTQIVRPLDRETGRARGFAFVEYNDRAVAEEAIRRFDGQLMMGRPLAVSEARARDDRGPGGPRPGGPGGPPRPGGYAPRPAGPGGGPGGPGAGPGGPRSGGGYAPRPGGGPGGPGGFSRPGGGFGAPRPGGPGGGAASARESNFGPPAPPKGKGPKKDYRKEDAKPRGPIPTKFTGRMYDLDEVDADESAADELPEFMKHEAAEDDAVDTARDASREDGDPEDRGR